MIEKMRFISIIGPKDDIDRVTDTYLSKFDIHLENTLTELSGLKNVHPFLEANPFQQLQRNILELKGYGHKNPHRPMRGDGEIKLFM